MTMMIQWHVQVVALMMTLITMVLATITGCDRVVLVVSTVVPTSLAAAVIVAVMELIDGAVVAANNAATVNDNNDPATETDVDDCDVDDDAVTPTAVGLCQPTC